MKTKKPVTLFPGTLELDVFASIGRLQDGSVKLLVTDPPYYKMAKDKWDHQWKTVADYAAWWLEVMRAAKRILHPQGSVVFFGGNGSHGVRPLWHAMMAIEGDKDLGLHFRDLITWKKRRAYGCPDRYLFTREEFAWYSRDAETWVFNIPLTDEKRGYAGFNKKYAAKSEFKRVSNVWVDIPELFKTSRSCEKPIPLMERIIATHSNPGDTVFDPFCGVGPVGHAAVKLGRVPILSDNDPEMFRPSGS